jgi:hypothetical protein
MGVLFFSKIPDALLPSPATFAVCDAVVAFQSVFPILCYQDTEELHKVFEVLTAVNVKLKSSGMWHVMNL